MRTIDKIFEEEHDASPAIARARMRAIHSARKQFRMQKGKEQQTLESVPEYIPSPKLDFAERTYHDIHNTLAKSISSMESKRHNSGFQKIDPAEYCPIELAAQKIAMARSSRD